MSARRRMIQVGAMTTGILLGGAGVAGATAFGTAHFFDEHDSGTVGHRVSRAAGHRAGPIATIPAIPLVLHEEPAPPPPAPAAPVQATTNAPPTTAGKVAPAKVGTAAKVGTTGASNMNDSEGHDATAAGERPRDGGDTPWAGSGDGDRTRDGMRDGAGEHRAPHDD